jgi:hypothetical protein
MTSQEIREKIEELEVELKKAELRELFEFLDSRSIHLGDKVIFKANLRNFLGHIEWSEDCDYLQFCYHTKRRIPPLRLTLERAEKMYKL